MAASRSSSRSSTGPKRVSFAKISEPLEVPDLLALQVESFDWLLGNDTWQARVNAAVESGNDEIPSVAGLVEVLEEISPIEDFNQTMSLTLSNPFLDDPKYTEEECREKDLTYAQPLYVDAEFMNNETGEIKSQTVFIGDFPLMTRKGTFIINGTER